MAKRQIVRLVDIETIELRLANPKTQDGTVEELYRFGSLVFSEIQQRGAELDRKLTNFLGWSLATLAFFLINLSKYQSWGFDRIVVTAASILSFSCVALAAFALKTKIWPAPSEGDWFKDELWDEPSMMKRYHVVSILATHQGYATKVKAKADCLAWIEVLLPISALGTLSVLLFS